MTDKEKELIVNTPINLECFEMVDSFSDYGDAGLGDLESLLGVWEKLTHTLETLRLRYIKTKNEYYFIELVRLIPNTYKVVKL